MSDRPDHDGRDEDRWTGEIHTAETLAIDFDSTMPMSTIAHELPTGETAVTDSPARPEVPRGDDPTMVMASVATGTTGEVDVADPTPVGGITRVRRRPRWRRRLLVGALVVLLLGIGYYGVTLYQVHSTGQSDQARQVDALVVMGAAHAPSDPSPQLAARLDHALDLWRAGLADTFVVTGGKIPGDLDTEAEASRDYLVEHGVDVADIQLENESRNTYDTFVGVVDLLGDDASVLIVTDPYHSLRSRLTAEELGLEAYVSPTRTSPVQGNSARTKEMKEAVGVALGRIIGFDRLLTLTG